MKGLLLKLTAHSTGLAVNNIMASVSQMLVILTAFAAEITPKQQLYHDVWVNSFWWWVIISVCGTAIVTIVAFAMERRGCLAIGALIVGLLVAFVGGMINAGSRANHAINEAWEAKVIEKATHIEKLLGVFVRTDVITYLCQYADTDSDIGPVAATGCANVTKNEYCDSRDDDGDCTDWDYEWLPWFTQEASYTGDLNIFKNGHLVFADHCAPPDWQNYLKSNDSWLFPGNNIPGNAVAGVHFCYEVPAEWQRADDAVKSHRLLPGVVYNTYRNWVHADPETVFRGSTYLVPEYETKGLMPTVLPIINSAGEPFRTDIYGATSGPLGYDFQIVQFLGSLNPPQEFQTRMQQQALLWASVAGPSLKTNIMANFAYADEVPNADQWISVTKAHLMDKEVFGREILPMNLSLFNCGVSRDLTVIEWCRMETGLFEGNIELKQDIAHFQPFPFTPEGLFGTLSGGFVLDASGKPVMADPDWDDRTVELATVEISFQGGVINEAMYGVSTGHKFVKVSMDQYSDKQFIIQPDPEQIEAIESGETAQTLWTIVVFWAAVIFIGGYIVTQAH